MHWTDFVVIISSGSFGGLLSSLYIHDGALILPKRIELELSDGTKRRNYHIGFLSDIILGAGAGLIGALPLGLEFPKYIYLAIIAGFGGGSFIAKQAKLTAEEKVSSQDKLPTIIASSAQGMDGPEEVTFELAISDSKGEK
ncbi:hypothetical protein [Paenibacillus azoreducens]|uniref:DUF4257 domain-containing protein n=1 Tax=Paenibacillus azoreducens TaxID=116718 RepID=A0A920CNK8_9BACL|nr:hypothetical protein [Paenibacillus azoreducens]GIO47576.1 hypothetical protein J34TS1_23410 [Paenibacillus azoreducens]